jgi:hypothetical protein
MTGQMERGQHRGWFRSRQSRCRQESSRYGNDPFFRLGGQGRRFPRRPRPRY